MAIPFSVHPVRQVPVGPADPRWTVQIHRAGSWPGWTWLDRILERHWGANELSVVFLLLALLPLPSVAARRLTYSLRRRRDWEVLVYRGGYAGYRPRTAVLVENQADRFAAEQRAELFSAHLLAHDALPNPRVQASRQ